MAEEVKVRLVRCPKCDNVLPEHPNYSVYQCGGCGTVLRAKTNMPVTDGLSDKSDEELRVEEKSESLDGDAMPVSVDNVAEIESRDGIDHNVRVEKKSESLDGDAVPVSVDNVAEIESRDGIDHNGMDQEARVFTEIVVNSVASSSSRIQNREALIVVDRNREREIIDMQPNQSRHKDGEDENRSGRSSKHPIRNFVHRDGEGVNLDRPKFYNSRVENEAGGHTPANGNSNGPLRSRDMRYQWEADSDDRNVQYWSSRIVGEHGKFSSSSYPNEEQMSYQGAYANNYGMMTNQDYVDGFKRVENLEHDRAELRRKLNELEDKLRRSSGVRDIPIELHSVDRRRVPSDPYGGYDTYMNPSQAVLQGRTAARPPYFNDSPVHVPSVNGHDSSFRHVSLVNRQDRDMRYLYSPPRNVPNSIPRYESPIRPEMPKRRPPPQLSPFQHPSQSSYNNTAGRYLGTSQDPIDPYPHETSLHHPSCSCVDCSYRNRQVPSHPTYYVDRNKGYQENSSFPSVYHDVNPVNRGSRYNSRELHSEYPQHRRANPNDLDSELGGTRPYRPRREVMSLGKRRLCYPLAGGAPFITCHNCSELLKVPRKFMLMEKHKRNLRCGACATLISFESESKGLIVSKTTHTEVIATHNDEIPNEVFNNNLKDSHPDSAYAFQSTGTETNTQSNEQRLNTNGSEIRQQEHHYSSSVSSEEKESPDTVIVPNNTSTCAEPSFITVSSDSDKRPYSNAASRYGMGNMSNIMNQESDFRNNSTFGSTVQDVEVPTDIDVSFNANSGTSYTHHSAEVNEGDRLLKPKKANRSFFVSLMKKSFRDSSRSNPAENNVRSNVSINGKPISPRAVEKAETLAGTIQPGDYWYDYRAGFWGVLGQPCHGIIPPFIQEFDFPMPRKCGAGNTGVCVNGRELHQKDLNLLARRGLPITSNKSYIIDISGKVMDENSGKELHNLSKLAPTVERTRKGFGMKVPQVST